MLFSPLKPTSEARSRRREVFGTSPHGLSADLHVAVQKNPLLVALDTLLLNWFFGGVTQSRLIEEPARIARQLNRRRRH